MYKCPVCGEEVQIHKNLIAPHSLAGQAEVCYGSFMPAPLPEEKPAENCWAKYSYSNHSIVDISDNYDSYIWD